MTFELTLAMRLRAAYLTLHRRVNALFAPYGLTADQFVVLSVLRDHPGLTQTELGGLIASDANTVTAMLRVLDRRGLVRRQAHVGDGRAWRVYLTAQGRRARRKLAEASASLHRDLEAAADGGGHGALRPALDRMAAAMAFTAPRRSRTGRFLRPRPGGVT